MRPVGCHAIGLSGMRVRGSLRHHVALWKAKREATGGCAALGTFGSSAPAVHVQCMCVVPTQYIATRSSYDVRMKRGVSARYTARAPTFRPLDLCCSRGPPLVPLHACCILVAPRVARYTFTVESRRSPRRGTHARPDLKLLQQARLLHQHCVCG